MCFIQNIFQEADMAITDLTITSDRAEAVDFSHPFMDLGETFIIYNNILALYKM